MDTWTGNYSIHEEMPGADEAEIQRVAREKWYRERNNRLIAVFGSAANWIGWGGGALFFALGFLWPPLFAVAVVLFGGWLVLYLLVMSLGLGNIILHLLGLEILRKGD